MEIRKEENQTIIIPEGVSTAINGMMASCTISELIKCLEKVKEKEGDVKIGIYDGFGQMMLRTDTEDFDTAIFMSCYN